jgi:RimJ/RimL family protein N-acetyltransferase
LRLQGIAEIPQAFATSYDEELARPENHWFEKLRAGNAEDVIFGAFLNQTLVGVVGIYRDTMHNRRHKSHIWGMYVAPQARGQGAAQQLVSAAISHARTIQGIESVMLSAEYYNTSARKLYEKLGFVQWGQQERAAKIGNEYLTEVHLELVFDV